MSHSELSDTQTESLEHKRLRKRRVILRTFLSLMVLIIIALGIYHFTIGRWYESTDDAYVAGNIVKIMPRIRGTVTAINVDDNDFVKKGDVLIKLDSADTHLHINQAEAKLAQTVRGVRALFATVHTATAEVAAREAALKQATADLKRRKGLAKSGAISAETLAHARDALTTARSALAAAKAKLATAKAHVSGTTITTQPDVKAAAAAVRKALLNAQRTTIRAPISGYIAKRVVQLGQTVSPASALMAVIPLNKVWVDANFKETQMSDMRIGQPVTLTSDIYGDDVVYHGHIQGLGMGTGSAFSLLPAQNASGNWIKVVQRVPVRVVLDKKDLKKHPLRIGMSMSAEVDMHNQKGASLASHATPQPIYKTNIYAHNKAAADKIIAQIIHANAGQLNVAHNAAPSDAHVTALASH